MKADLFIDPGAARILNPEVIGDCGTIHRENDLYGVSLFQIKLSQEKAGVGPAGIQAAVPEPGMQGGVFLPFSVLKRAWGPGSVLPPDKEKGTV